MKTILTLTLLFLALLCQAQTKTEIKPSVTLTEYEVNGIVAQIDTASALISRSDMAKAERNSSSDRIQLIRAYLLQKMQAVKVDTVKAKK